MMLWILAFAQTKSSAMLTPVVTAALAIAAKVSLTSSVNPSVVSQPITYSGTVTGSTEPVSPVP
jgi:hypothetical protein